MQEIKTIEEAQLLLNQGKLLGLFKMPEEVYRGVDAVNFSSLKELNRDSTPSHFKYAMEHPEEPTEAMVKGTLWHTALLEPEKLEERYAFWREKKIDGRTKEGKAQKELFDATVNGRIVISNDDYVELKEVFRTFKAHPIAPGILSTRIIEAVAFWIDEDTGLLCKCKPDAVLETGNSGAVFDVKTSYQRLSDTNFARTIVQCFYHWQAAFYLDGLSKATGVPHKQFVFVGIEKDPPYGIRLFRARDSVLEAGRRGYRQALTRLNECRKSDAWPSYSPEITEIELPVWANE